MKNIKFYKIYFSLKLICEFLQKMGAQALIYLAAAVSDFYVPELDMVLHFLK